MTINEKGEETLLDIEGRIIHFIQLERLVQVNSTRLYGNMSYKYGPHEQVKANREVFWSDLLHKVLEIKKSRNILEPVILNPQMSEEIILVEKEMSGEGWLRLSSLKCDGLLFLKPTPIIPLGFVAADCAPVSIYLPSSDTLMLVHVSRKNIAIIQDALEILHGLYLAAIYDTRGKIKLVSSSNPNFELFVIIGPAARYQFNTYQITQKEIFIDIHREVIKQLEEFEKKVPMVSMTVCCSAYHTTDSDSLFYSHHLISQGRSSKEEARFMSLTMLI